MPETPKGGWLHNQPGGNEDEALQETGDNVPGQVPTKTVMVYLLDPKTMRKEPIGIITEQRKSERDGNNAIGMLQLARKEFATSEEMAKRIVIGDYVY